MKLNKRLWSYIAIFFITFFAINIPIPYYIEKPGSAIPLGPMVQVQDGYHEKKGSLSLTTVRMGPTNIGGYFYALVSPYADVVNVGMVHSPHETDEQYSQRQLEIMKFSQDTAKIVAFQRAGYDVKIKNSGAIVMQLLPGFAAENVLQIGDVIIGVNDTKVETAIGLIEALKGKQNGDLVKITYIRDGQEQTANLELKPLPVATEDGKKKAGIGISSPITNRTFTLPKEVTIKSEEIGGPSAGLMFTLEMINQLSPEDITKGYPIAGTGTIQEDGSVGPIGGIEHKVVAAEREGIKYFFAPSLTTEPGEKSNYDEAVERAKDLDLKMEIVPVETVDDALRFLEKLKPMQGA